MTQLPLKLSVVDADTAGEYLTVAEAAARLHCCERTIRRAIESGELRAGRIRGGRISRGAWRIKPIDLEAWLFRDVAETG